ncbi:ORC-CDC6 family AAA ATPase, partial [Micromonosporaceae bacterium Da 78-11]
MTSKDLETKDLLHALQEVEKRAERGSDENVIKTYVDEGALVSALATRDNGIIYGRRGTGKTHALKYLAETRRANGDFVVYIDVEQDLGSTGSIYSDSSITLPERATRLLVDVIGMIHTRLLEDAFNTDSDAQIDLLDSMLDHFTEVIVTGNVEVERSVTAEHTRSDTSSAAATLGPKPGVTFGATGKADSKVAGASRTKATGAAQHRVHFGAAGTLLRRVVDQHPAKRFWLLFDEWSGLPQELQPYLGEMLRKIFFNLPKVTVRIAAIPHRTEWRVLREGGGYTGLEVGAEIFPALDLDEFVVFPARNRQEQTARATGFFKNLLFRHLNQALVDAKLGVMSSPEDVVKLLFTQLTALQELIRAAEGVPRDALNIVARAALRAGGSKIATEHVRTSAAQVYQVTKQALLNGTPAARQLLEVIISEVINKKKARAFLLSAEDSQHPLIQHLVDDRILHIIKRGYSGKAEPGVRFDVLQIDYGCYVQLLATQSAPKNLFGEEGPDDDTTMAALFAEDIE